MSRQTIYKNVDELPDLVTKDKEPSYKTVDELPDLKKKDTGGAGIFGTILKESGSNGLPTSNPSDFKSRGERGNLLTTTKQIPAWKKAPPTIEPVKQDQPESTNPIFAPQDNLKYTIDQLDNQELKEYNSQSGGVTDKPLVPLIKKIIESRKDPAIMKQRAEEFIGEDMRGEGKSTLYVSDQYGLDVPQYFNQRKKDIQAQMDELDAQLGQTDIPEKQQFLNGKINELHNKLEEINKYSNVLNKEYAIKSTNPEQFDNKSDYLKALGRNLNKVDNYEGVAKKEQNIATGEEKNRLTDIVQKEDFNDELTGINALQEKTIQEFKDGKIDEETAKKNLSDLNAENVQLENRYPKVKIDNIRGRLGELIAEKRKENDNVIASGFHNIIWSEPTEQEVQDAVRTLIANNADGKKKLDISEDEIRQLIKEKDKIPLTGALAHGYKTFILKPAESLSQWINTTHDAEKENYNRELSFRDPAINQSVQPLEIPKEQQLSDEVVAIRNAPNPLAGVKAGLFSAATLNNIAETAGIIGSYAVLNKLGGKTGLGNVGQNIASSTFLNYHDNLERAKQLTDDPVAQQLLATTKSAITGLVFSAINPNKLLGKVETAGEQGEMQKLLDAYKKDGIANTDPTKFKDLIAGIAVKTAKDLGKNIGLMDADKIAYHVIDGLANKRSQENVDLGQELIDELPGQLASLGIFSAIHGIGEGKETNIDRNKALSSLRVAATDIPRFEEMMKSNVDKGIMTSEDAKANTELVRNVAEKLMSNDLKTGRTENFTKEQKLSYAINLAKEQDLKDKSKDLTDQVQIDEHKRDLKELVDERKAIIDDKHDEYLQTTELYDRVHEKESHNKTLVAGTKTEGVEYMQEQALQAPFSIKKTLKGDTELTTDLISRNPPEEIKSEIKDLKEKQKKADEVEKKAESNDIQRNIDLLQEGLDKATGTKKEADTKLSVPIEGLDEQGIPLGDNVPAPTAIKTENGIVIEPPQNIPESIPLKPIEDAKAETQTTEPTKLTDEGTGSSNEPIATEESGTTKQDVPEEVLRSEGGDTEPNEVGVSHENLTDLAKRLGLKEPETGEWHSPEWYAERGRQLLAAGADPKEIDNPKNELHDRISIARAHLENLVKAADKIGKEKGTDSDEYQLANKEVNDYANGITKKLGNLAGQAMTSLQGKRDLDTDSFTAVKKATEDLTDKPLSKEQEEKIKDITSKNEELKKRAEDAEAKLIEATEKGIGDNKKEKGKYEKKARGIADKIMKSELPDWLKTDDPNIKSQGTSYEDVKKLLADATINMGKLLDKGIEFKDAVKEAIDDLVKLMGENKRGEIEKGFTEHYNNLISNKEEELAELQKQFVDKKGNKFTTDEAKAIWDYAKKHYLDKGVSYKDMIVNVHNDLGLSWRQVSDAITTPKTKRISDEMWKKQSDYKRNQNATKVWVENQNKSWGSKALKNISGAFRGVSVFGHGGIFVGTHAGMTFFKPSTLKYTIKAFLNGYRLAYGNRGGYERRMEQLKNSPNYVLAQRAGLKNNPERINAEEFQKSQHFISYIVGHKIGDKLSTAGEHGFNAIKILRQDLFDYHYNALSDVEKQDPLSAVRIAELVNLATGATNLAIPEWVNEVSFAGGMEAARWGKLTRSPIKATSVAMKAIFTPEKASVSDRVFAKVWAKRVGEQLGTFAGLLVANAALQSTINPKNPTNYTNPNQSDFLKFKFGDMTIDPTSGMRSIMMFMYGLGKIPFMAKKERGNDDIVKYTGKQMLGYGRGKLAPAYATMADFFFHSDYNKNEMPFSNEKPTAGHHKLTWGEYAWEKAPLPVAEAAQVAYQSALDAGADKVTLNHILNGIVSGVISGGTGVRVGEYNAEHAKHSPYTEEDKQDPTFKYFLDKGMELPNTSLSSEEITDEKNKTKKKVSEYPKEVQEKYTKIHKDELKKELAEIKKVGIVYVKEYTTANGDKKVEVSLKKGDSKDKKIKKSLDELSSDAMAQVLDIAQSKATVEAKKKVFYKK